MQIINNKFKIVVSLVLISGVLFAGLILTSAKNSYDILINYQKPKKAQDSVLLGFLKKEATNELVINIINDLFIIPVPISLNYGDNNGPEYDSESHRIFIPYSFIQEIKQRFIDDQYAETGVSVADATLDVVRHTILHEIAHALIHIYDLPIVIKEEDAADALATLLLIEFFEEGPEIAITAADIFELESNDIKNFEESDFWDEHSLDVQRYYNTLCVVYGSDPKKLIGLAKEAEFSDEKLEQCVDDYQQLYFSWAVLLKPHLKNTKAFNF